MTANQAGGRDRILLQGMRFPASIGVGEEERSRSQVILIDLEVEADLAPSGRSDDLSQTLDYRSLYEEVRSAVEGRSYRLVEALAEEISGKILCRSPARAVRVRIRKPHVKLGGSLEWAGVEIQRP
ncbi:MAG: dihydroneopterin aldolase [Firmicutes bacterium]|nr:dihydroneopterin aldolase [Bacillota bacterium]